MNIPLVMANNEFSTLRGNTLIAELGQTRVSHARAIQNNQDTGADIIKIIQSAMFRKKNNISPLTPSNKNQLVKGLTGTGSLGKYGNAAVKTSKQKRLLMETAGAFGTNDKLEKTLQELGNRLVE